MKKLKQLAANLLADIKHFVRTRWFSLVIMREQARLEEKQGKVMFAVVCLLIGTTASLCTIVAFAPQKFLITDDRIFLSYGGLAFICYAITVLATAITHLYLGLRHHKTSQPLIYIPVGFSLALLLSGVSPLVAFVCWFIPVIVAWVTYTGVATY
ncbi:MAG: hypothetical protein U1C53_03395, partial [Candidatus Veblenbacteria bacterium]|nr:hypothetical protein [Candidatus Veblenbacteria bacterium]